MRLRYLLLACLLVWALSGLAQVPCPTPFNPTVDSDALAVCAPSGALYDYVSVTEANENAGTIYTLALAGPDTTQFGHATVFCEYAGVCGPGLPQQYYSDIFGVASTNGGLYFAFSSDQENGTPYAGDSAFIYVSGVCGEHGGEYCGWYNATMYLDPTLQANGYTAWFVSEPTPEPTTMLLIGSGLGILARRLRKK